MLIKSAISPSTSDGHLPVSIFRYKDERRFLLVSDSYEETVKRVVNSFQIQPGLPVLLQTSSYVACQQKPVVIDSSAYPLLWPLLEDVEVVVGTKFVPEKDDVPMPDSDTHGTVQEPQLTTSRPASPVAGPSRDGLGAQMQDVLPTPPPINASEDELQKDDSELPTEAAQVQPESDPLFHWDDEHLQGIKQAGQPEKAPSTPQPKMKFKAATPSTKSGPAVTPVTKKQKQKGTDASLKLESLSNLDYPSKKPPHSVIDDDSRFEVVIVDPYEDNPTQFKLRGKNSVRKVLIAACRNFEVDPNRAYLVHSMELEVDGELQTHNFVCAPDDTMAMCGINEDSKLYVKVNPDMEDDPADDSSD